MTEYYEDVRSMIKSKCERNRSHNRTAEDKRFEGVIAKMMGTDVDPRDVMDKLRAEYLDKDDAERNELTANLLAYNSRFGDAHFRDIKTKQDLMNIIDDGDPRILAEIYSLLTRSRDLADRLRKENGFVDFGSGGAESNEVFGENRGFNSEGGKGSLDLRRLEEEREAPVGQEDSKKDPRDMTEEEAYAAYYGNEKKDEGESKEPKDKESKDDKSEKTKSFKESATPDMGASPGEVAVPSEESTEDYGSLDEMLDELGYMLGDIENEYGPEIAEEIFQIFADYMDEEQLEEIADAKDGKADGVVEDESAQEGIGKSVSFKDMMEARRNGDNMSSFMKSMCMTEDETEQIAKDGEPPQGGETPKKPGFMDRIKAVGSKIKGIFGLNGNREPAPPADPSANATNNAAGNNNNTNTGSPPGEPNAESPDTTGLDDKTKFDYLINSGYKMKGYWNQHKQHHDFRQAYRQRQLDARNAYLREKGVQPGKTEVGRWARYAPTFGGAAAEQVLQQQAKQSKKQGEAAAGTPPGAPANAASNQSAV